MKNGKHREKSCPFIVGFVTVRERVRERDADEYGLGWLVQGRGVLGACMKDAIIFQLGSFLSSSPLHYNSLHTIY